MSTTSYGYRTAKWVNYAAWAYTESGACYALTACATSRKLGFAMIAKQAEGDRIVGFQSEDEMTRDEAEQWGFKPETIRTARINWSALDLY